MLRTGPVNQVGIGEDQAAVAVAEVPVGTEPTWEDCARILLSTGLEPHRLALALEGTGLTVPAALA